MSNVHVLLNRLMNVKCLGKDRWKACCPAHGGKKQSLAIRDDNGKILIHCFAEGCAINAVLVAIGLTFADIMPEQSQQSRPNKKPFYASDVLQICRDEILVAYMITNKCLNVPLELVDRQRLFKCAYRLRHACALSVNSNGSHISVFIKCLPDIDGGNHA